MSAQPKDLYGEDNIVSIRDAIGYAEKTRDDVDTRGAVTKDDVKTAFSKLADDDVFIACFMVDHRKQNLNDMGRVVDTQILLERALRLQQPMP